MTLSSCYKISLFDSQLECAQFYYTTRNGWAVAVSGASEAIACATPSKGVFQGTA